MRAANSEPPQRSASRARRALRWMGARLTAFMRQVPPERDGAARVRQRHIYILPTGTGLLFAGVLFITLLGSLNYQNNLGLLFTFLLASVALVSMHLAWFNLLGLEIRTAPGAGVFAGDDAHFTLTLREPGRRPRSDLRIGGAKGRSRPASLAHGAQDSMTLTQATTRRGHVRLGAVPIETRHPLALFRAWCTVASPARVWVYPRPAPSAPPPPLLAAAGAARAAQGERGEGANDYVGPRGYRPGDSPRRLDWKALARERGLVVKQFGGDQAEEIWLDWAQLPASDTETRLSQLCRQVLDAAAARSRFGLRLPGRIIPLDSGAPHRQRCLEALASFEQDPL